MDESKQELERQLQLALQWKAYCQGDIEDWEQGLSAAQKELSQPSLSKARQSELEKEVKDCEGGIQRNKKLLLAKEEAIKKLQDALGQLTYITSEATRLRIFSHPPAKPLKDDEGQESQSQPILYKDERIPGTVLVKDQRILKKVSSARKTIDLESDTGIRIDIPEGTISPDESVDLLIQPCFSGSFEIPEDMEPASPAYLIETSEQIVLKKPLMMKMQHSVKLQTEEDCKNIVFLRASSNPEYRGSNPVYVFKEVEDVRGTFTIENQFGEVALTNFSWWRVFFRKRRIKGEILYSARLYRSLSAAAEVSAVFCMCPHHTFYTRFCDKSIHEGYSGISEKAEGRTVYNALAITSDAVALKAQDTTKCIMDKSEISKAEIDFPEANYEEPSKIPDYPPRISISCTTTAGSESLILSTEGLEKECTFTIIPAATTQSTSTHPLLQSTTRIAQPATQTSNQGWFWWTVIAFSLLAVIFAPSYIVPSSKDSCIEQTPVDLGRIDATARLDKPELSSLEHLKGPHSDVRIIHDSGDYKKLGICLLKLPNAAELDDMERDCSRKTYCIKLAIFNKWLQGQGEKPVTWKTLIYVLEECMQLVELAKDVKLIIASTQQETPDDRSADETLARASSTVTPR